MVYAIANHGRGKRGTPGGNMIVIGGTNQGKTFYSVDVVCMICDAFDWSYKYEADGGWNGYLEIPDETKVRSSSATLMQLLIFIFAFTYTYTKSLNLLFGLLKSITQSHNILSSHQVFLANDVCGATLLSWILKGEGLSKAEFKEA